MLIPALNELNIFILHHFGLVKPLSSFVWTSLGLSFLCWHSRVHVTKPSVGPSSDASHFLSSHTWETSQYFTRDVLFFKNHPPGMSRVFVHRWCRFGVTVTNSVSRTHPVSRIIYLVVAPLIHSMLECQTFCLAAIRLYQSSEPGFSIHKLHCVCANSC